MRFLKALAVVVFLSCAWIGAANAQQVNLYCLVDTGPPLHWAPCSSTVPLNVTIAGSGGGGVLVVGNVSNASSGVATTSTNVPNVSYNYAWNGTTWDQVRSGSNASSGVATGAAGNVDAIAYNYVWNGTTWDQAAGVPLNSNNAVPTISLGTNALATNQVSVASSATLIVAARTGATGTGRKSVTITNITGTGPFYVGNTGLTTSTGMYVGATAGASITLDTQAAIFGIVPTTAQSVSFVETF